MQILIGQTLIHPFHGPLVVTGMSDRTFKGNQVTYVQLEVKVKELSLQVPLHKADEIGLRPVMSEGDFKEILAVLAEETEPNNDTWAHRIKEYQRNLQDGSNLGRAAVIRDIVRKHGGQPMPGTEKQMLQDALELLCEEGGLCLDKPQEEVRVIVLDAVGAAELVA